MRSVLILGRRRQRKGPIEPLKQTAGVLKGRKPVKNQYCGGFTVNPAQERAIEKLLEKVEKPARYTGGEMNTSVKPFGSTDISSE